MNDPMHQQAVIFLLLPLVVEQSTPTSDLEVSLIDPEVSSGDPRAASERRLRASSSYNEDSQPKHVLPINKQVSAFLPGNRYKRSVINLPGELRKSSIR